MRHFITITCARISQVPLQRASPPLWPSATPLCRNCRDSRQTCLHLTLTQHTIIGFYLKYLDKITRKITDMTQS